VGLRPSATPPCLRGTSSPPTPAWTMRPCVRDSSLLSTPPCKPSTSLASHLAREFTLHRGPKLRALKMVYPGAQPPRFQDAAAPQHYLQAMAHPDRGAAKVRAWFTGKAKHLKPEYTGRQQQSTAAAAQPQSNACRTNKNVTPLVAHRSPRPGTGNRRPPATAIDAAVHRRPCPQKEPWSAQTSLHLPGFAGTRPACPPTPATRRSHTRGRFRSSEIVWDRLRSSGIVWDRPNAFSLV